MSTLSTKSDQSRLTVLQTTHQIELYKTIQVSAMAGPSGVCNLQPAFSPEILTGITNTVTLETNESHTDQLYGTSMKQERRRPSYARADEHNPTNPITADEPHKQRWPYFLPPFPNLREPAGSHQKIAKKPTNRIGKLEGLNLIQTFAFNIVRVIFLQL